MTTSLPASLGGPQDGRPISESDEHDRVSTALNEMMLVPVQGGQAPYRNLLPFYAQMLVGATIHVGRAALQMVPTACVFFGKDGRINLVFNPYYLDEVQKVLVAWPSSVQEMAQYEAGTVDGRPWLVRSGGFRSLPSFIRGVILTDRLKAQLYEKFLQAAPDKAEKISIEQIKVSELMEILGFSMEERQAVWSRPLEDFGIDPSVPVAVRIDNSKLVALIVHEVLHVAHLHLLADRERYKDARRLSLAMDVAIDQFIDGVPDDLWAFYKEAFAKFGETLEANESFDFYYERLGKFHEDHKKQIQTGPSPGGPPGGNGSGKGGPGSGPPGGNGSGKKGKGSSGSEDDEGDDVIVVPGTVDDHQPWNGNAPPGPIQVSGMVGWLQTFSDKSKTNAMWGSALGTLVRQIDTFLKPKVKWERLLKKFVGDCVRMGREPTRKRPSRRHGWDAPGKKTLRSGKVIVAIDNSGSISPQEAMQFFGEISSMLSMVEVVIIVWDTNIQRVRVARTVSDLKSIASDLGGGGGTYVIPVFEAIANPSTLSNPAWASMISGASGLVVLTDGDLQWPGPEYDLLPVFWGITRERNLEGPQFGKAIFVDLSEE